MDFKDRGIGRAASIARNAAVILWVIVSSVAYGTAAICVSFFSRRMARRIARQWSVHLLWLAGVKVSVNGLEHIDIHRQYVFVANHQSYFDIPVLYSGLGSMISFIAKKELFRIPFFGWGMWAIGCINLDRENPRRARTSLSKAVSVLRRNKLSVFFFPEGTRSDTGKVGPFKRASFTFAFEASVPIVPVAICGTRKIQKKESLRILPAAVTLVICPPISSEIDKEQLSGMAREMILKAIEGICDPAHERLPSGLF